MGKSTLPDVRMHGHSTTDARFDLPDTHTAPGVTLTRYLCDGKSNSSIASILVKPSSAASSTSACVGSLIRFCSGTGGGGRNWTSVAHRDAYPCSLVATASSVAGNLIPRATNSRSTPFQIGEVSYSVTANQNSTSSDQLSKPASSAARAVSRPSPPVPIRLANARARPCTSLANRRSKLRVTGVSSFSDSSALTTSAAP